MCLQLILVVILIFWPGSVTYWLDKGTGVDPSKVNIEIPLPQMPPPIDFSCTEELSGSKKSPGATRRGTRASTRRYVRLRMRIMNESNPSSATCIH